MAKLFFSYSHKDEDLRDELEVHLSALRREGVIELWHDRRIGAGKDFGNEIGRNLEEADVVLLLISHISSHLTIVMRTKWHVR